MDIFILYLLRYYSIYAKGSSEQKRLGNRDINQHFSIQFFFVSALLWDYSLCWDRWKWYMTPTLDAALLISSRAGADLGWTLDSRV